MALAHGADDCRTSGGREGRREGEEGRDQSAVCRLALSPWLRVGRKDLVP